jgi:hypothetical protein
MKFLNQISISLIFDNALKYIINIMAIYIIIILVLSLGMVRSLALIFSPKGGIPPFRSYIDSQGKFLYGFSTAKQALPQRCKGDNHYEK